MRTLLAATVLFGALATGGHAATYDEKLATCLACHGEKGISETTEVPSLAGTSDQDVHAWFPRLSPGTTGAGRP